MEAIFENLAGRAKAGRAALIFVDVQNDFLHPSGLFARQGYFDFDENARATFVKNNRELLEAARKEGIEIVFVKTSLRADHRDSALSSRWYEHGLTAESGFLVEGSWGCDFLEEIRPEKDDFVVVKKGHGAFVGTSLDRLLTNLGVVTCFFTGTGGVAGGLEDTLRQASPLGYQIYIVADATYPPDDSHIRNLDKQGDVIGTVEAIRFIQKTNWPEKPSINKHNLANGLALLLLQLQNDPIHPQGANARYNMSALTPEEFSMVVSNNRKLIAAMRQKGYPLIHTTSEPRPDELDVCLSPIYYVRRSSKLPIGAKHQKGSWGNQFIDDLQPAEGEMVLLKKAHSAFTYTHLHRLLRNLNVNTCLVTGGSVKACANDTIRDGIALGYHMVPISDATYPPNSDLLTSLAERTPVMTTEEALGHLEGLTRGG